MSEAALISRSVLKQILIGAVREFYAIDGVLIKSNIHEVTIAHRLALYVEKLLRESGDSELHVDIEYNKNMKDQKRLVRGEDGKRPDIIVHKRQSNKHNQLIIEVKKGTSKVDDNDDRKLKEATDPSHSFRYTLGAYLNLTPDQCTCTWYCHGSQAGEESILPTKREVALTLFDLSKEAVVKKGRDD